MSTSRIPPFVPSSYEPLGDRSGSGTDARNGAREVPNQSQNAQEGNVTAPERVSPEIKKEAIDERKRDAQVRAGRHRVDVKG